MFSACAQLVNVGGAAGPKTVVNLSEQPKTRVLCVSQLSHQHVLTPSSNWLLDFSGLSSGTGMFVGSAEKFWLPQYLWPIVIQECNGWGILI